MCNFCDFLDTTDVDQLAHSNPWSTEEQYAVPCEGVSDHKTLEFPMAENYLLDMIPSRSSSLRKTRKRQQRPAHYPSFRISTIQTNTDEVGVLGAYEVNRRSTILVDADFNDSKSAISTPKRSFSLNRHSLSLAIRPSTRRSNVSFMTTTTNTSPRSSTSTRTPDSPSSGSDTETSSSPGGYFVSMSRAPSYTSTISEQRQQRYSTAELIAMIDRQLKGH